MSSTPPLPVHNRFACLAIEEGIPSSESDIETTQDVHVKHSHENAPSAPRTHKTRWERRLPSKYIIAATPTPKSLSLKVEIQTTDTGQTHGLSALIDCGVTGSFIDSSFVATNQLTACKLRDPIPVFNVDGTVKFIEWR